MAQDEASTPARAAAEPAERRTVIGAAGGRRRRGADRETMIPARSHRSAPEAILMRLIATFGIVGIGVAIGAIMTSQHSHGWLIGLVVAAVSVVLAAVLWSSRRL